MMAKYSVFDGHNDLLSCLLKEGDPTARSFFEGRATGHIDLAKMRAGGVAGGLFAVWPRVAAGTGPDPAAMARHFPAIDADDARRDTIAQLAIFARLTRSSPDVIRACLSAADIRLCVVVKRGEDPEIILNQLYKFTQLRESFSVIMIALVDGRPELLPLKSILEQYVRHRKEVITRRTRYLLARAEEREHIVAGLLKAIDIIDKVIALIRKSKDAAVARQGLVDQFAAPNPLSRRGGVFPA